MAFRFRHRIKLLPGVHLNLWKTGLSVSAGVTGANVTLGHTGLRKTVGLPGSGLSYSQVDTKVRTPTSYKEILGGDSTVEAQNDKVPEDENSDLETALSIANLFPDEPEKLCCYLWLFETQCGPYSWFQVVVMLADQTINFETLVWADGLDGWKALGSLDLVEMVMVYRKVINLS